MNDSAKIAGSRVILLGARSRAAEAIRQAMPGADITGIVRSHPREGEIATSGYTVVPDEVSLEGAVIVNCVGSPRGDADALRKVNHDVPVSWATAGKAAGAAGMVQISSFSIFGPAERVDADTPAHPVTDYGRSKLAAEEALAGIADAGFPIALLRVPILVGGGSDKLAQLVALARRTGLVPAASYPTPRSMLPYQGLAVAVRKAVAERLSGPVFAADPEPFTPAMLQDVARDAGKTVRQLPLPAPATWLIGRALPGLYASLLSPSLLAPEVNLLAHERPSVGLRDIIARLFAA